MYRIFFFSLTLISALISGLSAQNCNPLTGLQANNRFPFGEAVTFEVVGETGVDFEVKIGMSGFDVDSQEYDTLLSGEISFQNEGYTTLEYFEPEVQFECYGRVICSGGDSSAWFGPVSFSRPIPPPPCGMSMEQACEIQVNADSLPYFDVPASMFDQSSIEIDSCEFSQEFAWYVFTAPDVDTLLIRSQHASQLSISNSNNENLLCIEEECPLGGEGTQAGFYQDTLITDFEPGEQYYARVRDGAIWDATCVTNFAVNATLAIQALTLPLQVSYLGPVDYDCEGTPLEEELDIIFGCPPYTVSRLDSLVDSTACVQVRYVNFTITDDCGETAEFGTVYTVSTDLAPAIVCPPNDTLIAQDGLAGAQYFIEDLIVEGGCTDYEVVVFQNPSYIYPVGDHLIEFGLFDQCGTELSCTTTLLVQNASGLDDPLFSAIDWKVNQERLDIRIPSNLIGSTLRLHDLNGRLILEETLHHSTQFLNLPPITSAYVLSIRTRDGKTWSNTLLVD